MAAARARAKAEAAKARTTFVKRETEVILEKAKLEAKLHTLQHEKEVAAATAEAEVLESVAAEFQLDESRGDIAALPHEPAEKRTSDYIDCISTTLQEAQPFYPSTTRVVHQTYAAEQTDVQSCYPLTRIMHQSHAAERTATQPHFRLPYQPARGQSTAHQPPSPAPKEATNPSCTTDHAGMSDITDT